MTKLRKLISLSFIVIFPFIFPIKMMFSQFLLDDEDIRETEKKTIKEEKKEESELPEHSARNVKALLVPDIKGAIKITWDIHKNSDNDYIVGRSSIITNSIKKALKATSIKIVPAGVKTIVIDSNLSPGEYYYCILSKKEVMDQKIELFPEMNFTTTPVIIEKATYEPFRGLPQQVTLILARKMKKNRILLTWRGSEARNIIYNIYRGIEHLDTPEKFSNAEKIAVIADGRESYIDKTISKSGTYYYAVTTKDVTGNEDLNLIPDQSYTTTGVFINVGPQGIATNIKVRLIDDGYVRISWDEISTGISEYLLYRYSQPISNEDRIAIAHFVDNIKTGQTTYIDKEPGFGHRYYAVITRLDNGSINYNLKTDENYTSEPISIGKPIHMKSLSAELKDKNVELTWKFLGSIGNKHYRIIRSETRIKNYTDIEESFLVDYVNVFDETFTDEKPPPGEYYYAIVPEDKTSQKKYKLIKGVNVITDQVMIPNEHKISKSRITPKKQARFKTKNKKRVKRKYAINKTNNNIKDIDRIIQATFNNRRYNSAIKELKYIIKNTDNKYEIAKANLYIGRALIELHRYRNALDYLLRPYVKTHFPEDFQFWSDYALSRID